MRVELSRSVFFSPKKKNSMNFGSRFGGHISYPHLFSFWQNTKNLLIIIVASLLFIHLNTIVIYKKIV